MLAQRSLKWRTNAPSPTRGPPKVVTFEGGGQLVGSFVSSLHTEIGTFLRHFLEIRVENGEGGRAQQGVVEREIGGCAYFLSFLWYSSSFSPTSAGQ